MSKNFAKIVVIIIATIFAVCTSGCFEVGGASCGFDLDGNWYCEVGDGYGYGTCDPYGPFVATICEGPAVDAGMLEVSTQVKSPEFVEVCYDMEYEDTVGSLCVPVIDGWATISSPGAPPDGRVEVRATAYTNGGTGFRMFTDSDPVDSDRYATVNYWEVDYNTSDSGGDPRMRVELDDIVD
jgi:hypothetical protein